MKKRLSYLIRFYLLTVLIFLIAKWVFMLFNHAQTTYTMGDMLAVWRHGMSLDLSTALYFFILPFLMTMVGMWVNLPQKLFKSYYIFIAVAFALAFVSDTLMYKFWHFKLDAAWLSYLETPKEVFASLKAGLLTALLFFLAISGFLVYKAYDKWAGMPVCKRGSWLEQAIYILMMPLMVIGIRGGLGESTTNTGQVYFSQNQFLNHAAVNPIFSFFYTMSHQLDDLTEYQFFDAEECEKMTQGVYTTASVHRDTLLNTDRPDILVILMEGAGEQFETVMPHLQELKKEGVYFSQCFANSWRTDRGTVCALSGYPSFPNLSVMKMTDKSAAMAGIAKTLRQQGYDTHYLYGGDINFTNMRSYMIATGWETLTSMNDYPLSEQRTSQWGVRDDITFATVYQWISQADDKHRHLWGYSTLSSHEPWDVPVKKLDDEVENSFAYLDDCLYDFVSKLKATPQWKNLLIVVTSDHGIVHGKIDHMTPLQMNHIPMLWLGGVVRQPRVIDVLCNQSDLPATLFGQLHLNHDDFTFSRDVLSETYTAPTVVHNFNNVQWICDSTGHVLYDFDLKKLTINESPDAERLERLDKAMIQLTTTDLLNR